MINNNNYEVFMFRKTVNGDITDEDFKKILIPFSDNYDEF